MNVSEYLFNQIQSGDLDKETGKQLLEDVVPEDIAIVGMSCEYTDIDGIHDFYDMNRYGTRGFKKFPKERIKYIPKDHDYLLRGADHLNTTPEKFLERLCQEQGSYLENLDLFDPEFFGLSEEEARYIDPTHRLILEHSYLALEDAGIKIDEIKDSKTAIYVGKDKSITANYRSEIEEDSNYVNSGTWEGILASRLNYLFNLSGGSFVIDTACSSSLVAAHIAVKTLREKEIDTAIVGGIALGLFPRQGSTIDQYSDVETSKPFLKVFDAQSEGTIFGEGAGIVVLKRLKDAIADNDNIHSIIRGSMINSDGKSNGLTAPNPHAQKDLLLDVYERNMISPESVDYIDAHGTGTKLGDPIEVRGLTDAYRRYSDRKGFCALTSLKENIGHTVGAAGVGGLIKMSLALQNKEIFPVESFEAPNEYIKFVDSPFYIPTKLQEWKKGKYPRRGGISSFGFSGTNAHVILEEYEHTEKEAVEKIYPIVFSAQTMEQIVEQLESYQKHETYIRKGSLQDISYTLVRKRNHFTTRLGFEAGTMDELFKKIELSIQLLEGRTHKQDIFASEAAVISSDLKKMMDHRLKNESDSFELSELIKLYVEGYDSALQQFSYQDAKVQSLPGYKFKKQSLWANVRKHNIYENVEPGLEMPTRLIKKQTLKTPKNDIYAVTLSPKDWFVDDHRIQGKRTFSGTTYTELAAELASIYFDEPAYEIEKLLLKNLIQLSDAESSKTFYVHVNKGEENQVEISIYSYEEGDLNKYVEHATFVLKALRDFSYENLDVEADLERNLEAAVFPSDESDAFKGRWEFKEQNFRYINKSENEIIAALTLKQDFLIDNEEFYLHPSILDGLLGGMVYERAQAFQKFYLPLSYGKFTFTGNSFTRTMYSKAELLYDIEQDHDVISANVSLYNEAGQLVAYLDKYTMKSVENVYFTPHFHNVVWQESGLEETVHLLDGESNVLVLTNQDNLKVGTERIRYQDYQQLEEKTVLGKYDYVIYAPWFGKAEIGSEDAERESLYYFEFAKKAAKLLKRNGKLILAANNGFFINEDEGKVNPLNYALLSSGRILGLENTGITTLMINCESLDSQKLIALAQMTELENKKVIYKESKIFIEKLKEMDDMENRSFSLEEEDCVIVTGGYGGIGLEYVSKLVELNTNSEIAVLGRTDVYTQLTQKAELTEQESQKLNKIQRLVDKGNIQFYSCDITDEHKVEQTIESISKERTIKGVIHLAGVPEDGMLFSKTPEEFLKVVLPKVKGTLLLKKYLQNQPLEFFLMSSSMTTISGSPGQFSYTFANSFLEGCSMAAPEMKTVLWPGWNEVGMALDFGDMEEADQYLLMKSLSTAAGGEYLGLSFSKQFNKVIMGEFNSMNTEKFLSPYIVLPDEFLAVEGAGEDTEQGEYVVKNYEELIILGAEEQDEIEKFITVIFASVLGLDEIDVTKSFTELGGDSLKAFGIYSPVAEQFEIDIEVADVFIYPTVNQLSDYVKELIEENAA
ncbi:SDR family NAD(P)-dependent oxidoreductase [Listeria monocytogenes]|uniref:SDR family NAD(P)-dependent oxidoreductase n=1 Tax=Listeria monocytogenes TaxID=1639 RepID=UPI0010D1F31E|nr:SDR family NAD(P)-dependent oxidoreductase [Listeria monocytogenes]EAD7632592.1 SDR family NAD(P)-dependent oxidoreductase [Listeria monocytogenes]